MANIQVLKDGGGRVIGKLYIENSGDQRLENEGGRVLGRYKARNNKTEDCGGRIIGSGNILTTLLRG